MAKGGKMGEVVEVDEKGRILIPISIRNTLGIEKGVKLVLEIRGSEIVMTPLDKRELESMGEHELNKFLSRP
jgi:AbrB family looped-hinge helix DNA binding protein